MKRMSRLLLISNDGSPRFYREVESLLNKHGDRVWCCRLTATAEELGSLTIKGTAAKALLIEDRKALAVFLGNLAVALGRV